MKAPALGFKLEAESGAMILTFPNRYPWLALYLLFLDCVLVTMALTSSHGRNSGPELPGMVVYAGIVALTLLIVLCFTNIVRITRTSRSLAITRFFLGFPRTTEFNLSDVRNVRIYGPVRNNKNSRKFQVLFDYGKETITLATGMSHPTADLIAQKLV
jgi:hypothetical protein